MPQVNPQSGEIFIGSRFSSVIRPENSAQLESLKATLPTGTRLEVQAAIGPDGRQGLVIQGQFVPAELPAGVNPGDKLQVLVIDNRTQLVLKLIGAAPQEALSSPWAAMLSGNVSPGRADLQSLLELLLPESKEALRSLKELTAALVTKLPEELMEVLPDAMRARPAAREAAQDAARQINPQSALMNPHSQAAPELPAHLDSKVPEILRILITHPALKQALITDRDLNAPAATLANRLAEALTASLREPLAQMNALIQNRQRPQDTLLELRLVLALRRQVELTIGSQTLSFEPQSKAAHQPEARRSAATPADRQENAEALKPALETLMLALENMSPQTLPRLLELLKSADPHNNPLLLLLKTLKILNSEVIGTMPNPSQDLAALVKTLLKDLQGLRDGKSGEHEIRQQLNQAFAKLNLHTQNILDKNVRQSLPPGTAEILKNLEVMTGAREALSQMNPLMQALGQPQHFVTPLLLGGFFGPLSLSLEAPQKASEEQQEESQDQAKDYIRLSLSFSMPALGMIRLDLAHRPEEVLIKLACASSAATDFIQKRLPALESAIRSLGYRKTSLVARTQTPTEASPDWQKALHRAAIIA